MKNNFLDKLVEISRFYGSNEDYVIAGGGNTSYKDDHYLWIKASGTSLATIEKDGFIKLNRKCLGEIAQKKYHHDPFQREIEIKNDLLNCISGSTCLRPSVETSLHNLLSGAYVVHTHPALVNGLMCSKSAASISKKLFTRGAVYIPYTDPGYVLFKIVEEKLTEYREKKGEEPTMIFLENHGIFVAGNTIQDVKSRYTCIERILQENMNTLIPGKDPCSIEEYTKELNTISDHELAVINNLLAYYFVSSKENFKKIQTALTPDHIVYCKARYLFVDSPPEGITKHVKAFFDSWGYYPRVIGIKHIGIICREENTKAVLTVKKVYEDMMKIAYYAENFGGIKALNKNQIDFIDNWEVENYRRKVARG